MNTTLSKISTQLLTLLEPEAAHKLTLYMLKKGLGPKAAHSVDASLAVNVAGLSFPNPLGLAAGFDKNAEVPDPLLSLGFGFVEVGAVTPKAQAGNARPRAFRLRQDKAVINRYGFNNDGQTAIANRLKARKASHGIIGINLGANKESSDKIADFVTGIEGFAGLVDFCTVNISSPNTPGLRSLQDKNMLEALLTRIAPVRVASNMPVFLKISPDVTDEEKADIVALALAYHISGLIVSNTTTTRPPGLESSFGMQNGGLSGAPLFSISTRILAEIARETKGRIPLIGVGGISNARQAYKKILSGASLLQLYTALIYEGPDLPARILAALPLFLAADGFSTIAEAVGADL